MVRTTGSFYWYGCIRSRMAAWVVLMERSLDYVTSCQIFALCAPVSGGSATVAHSHTSTSAKKVTSDRRLSGPGNERSLISPASLPAPAFLFPPTSLNFPPHLFLVVSAEFTTFNLYRTQQRKVEYHLFHLHHQKHRPPHAHGSNSTDLFKLRNHFVEKTEAVIF